MAYMKYNTVFLINMYLPIDDDARKLKIIPSQGNVREPEKTEPC